MCEVKRVTAPGGLPVFWRSPVRGRVSRGLRLVALNSARDELEPMLSVPAVKVFEGFAALAVKFAPDPTVMPTAARTTASAAMVRRGCAARADRRDTERLRRDAGTGHEPRTSPCWLGPLRTCIREAPGGSSSFSAGSAPDLNARSHSQEAPSPGRPRLRG